MYNDLCGICWREYTINKNAKDETFLFIRQKKNFSTRNPLVENEDLTKMIVRLIKFETFRFDGMKIMSAKNSATFIKNFTLNGSQLPKGTRIDNRSTKLRTSKTYFANSVNTICIQAG